MKRIVLAGLLGGVVAFAWSSLAHLVLPLGGAGVRTLRNEAKVTDTLREQVTEPGLYVFPGQGFGSGATPEQRREWEERYRTGPAGILVFRPSGGMPLSPLQLVIELLADIACATIAALVVVRLPRYPLRVLLVALLGLFAWLSIEVSYWNWFGFPREVLAASLIDQVGGFFLAGLAIAWLARPRPLSRRERAARAEADA